MTKVRGPLAAGLLLFVGTLLWAWTERGDVQEREFDQLTRQADSLARGLAIVAQHLTPGSEGFADALQRELREHLRLRRPFRFALVARGSEVLAEAGPEVPPDALSLGPGLTEDGRLFVIKTNLLHSPPPEWSGEPPGEPPPRRPPPRPDRPPPRPAEDERRPRPPGPGPRPQPGTPWDWAFDGQADGAGGDASLTLVVGLDPAVNPRALQESIVRIGSILLIAWALILTLILSWSRSIRSRDLVAALEAERRERERLAEMSLAAAGLAHETRNPLGLILGVAQRLQARTEVDDTAREAAEQIIDAADRAAARLSDFINFARMKVPEIKSASASEVLGRVIAVLKPDFDEAGVQLVLEVENLHIQCDPAMLEQVVINLLLNSLQASKPGSTTGVRLVRQGATSTLAVFDQGSGIAPELLPNLFKPYVSGRPDGHGLGLAIVKRIVDQHGWTVTVKSVPEVGTTFTVSGIRLAARAETRP